MRERGIRDLSSEYLRLALPLMSKHAIPVTPPNYAVWYAYVSGENAALREVVDELIREERDIGQSVVDELYDRFLASFDQVKFDEARNTFRSVVEKLGSSVDAASGEVSKYVDSLESYTERLAGNVDSDVLKQLVAELANETRHVHDRSADLHGQLQDSQREADALRQQLQTAKEEAIKDALTGLTNRKGLDLAMEKLMAADGADGPHCLLIGDIDKFKRINDNYGHLLGDKVIKFVAKIMQESVKGKDVVARFGGEEFVVLLPLTEIPGALAVAESIRSAIECGRLVRSDTKKPIGTVTISFGAARYRPGEGLEALISRADEALYRAKSSGRNRVETEAEPVATGTLG